MTTRLFSFVAAGAAALVLAVPPAASAQTRGRATTLPGDAAPIVEAPPQQGPAPRLPVTPRDPSRVTQGPSPENPDSDIRMFRRPRPVVRIGQDYTVRGTETTDDVVLVSGSAQIDGHVVGDVVVVLGSLQLGPTAVIDGDVVVVGGGATIAAGASIRRDLVLIGGAETAPPDFVPGGEHVVIGSSIIGDRVMAFVPWVTGGLMLGRPIVPSLGWVWVVVAIFFFISLVLGVVFEPAVRACSTALAAKPLTTFFTGLLTLLLVGPVSVILAVSVIGIAVIPFLLCAMVIAWTIGKIAVTRWLGARVIHEDEPENKAQVARSIAIGFAIITITYMVPLLGIMAWLIVGVLGLGSATSTLFKALRRENPAAPRPPRKAATTVLGVPGSGVGGMVAGVPIGQASTISDTPAGAASFSVADGPPPSSFETPAFAGSPAEGAPAAAAYAPPYGGVPDASGDWDLLSLPRATFWRRVAAAVLDFVLVMIVFQMMDLRGRRDEFWFCALLVIYLTSLWAWRGTTIGGIIANLRVIRTDGTALSGPDSIIRAVSSLFSAFMLGLGFLWILKDPERQGWHDKIAGTYVVMVPRSTPLR